MLLAFTFSVTASTFSQTMWNKFHYPQLCTKICTSQGLAANSWVLITVILKVKSFNNPPPEFQIVQVWRDGDGKRKMIRVESGIFWMDALWHHKTDCEWLSLTSVCAVTLSQRWSWSLCCLRGCYSPAEQVTDGDWYMQTTKQRWRFRAQSVLVCDSLFLCGQPGRAHLCHFQSQSKGSAHIDWYIYDSRNEAVQTELCHRTFSHCVMAPEWSKHSRRPLSQTQNLNNRHQRLAAPVSLNTE